MKNLMENWNRFINEANEAAAEAAVEDLDLSPEEMQAALKMLQGEKVQLEEGVMDSVGSLVKRFGKKAIMAALVTSLAAGAAAPGKAYAADLDTGATAAAQVVDAKAEKDAAAALGLISTYVDTKVEKGADRVVSAFVHWACILCPMKHNRRRGRPSDCCGYHDTSVPLQLHRYHPRSLPPT